MGNVDKAKGKVVAKIISQLKEQNLVDDLNSERSTYKS
jgi:hypothetical protein